MKIAGKKFIVTGAAGFIGSAISKKLLQLGADVLGIDNINSYYDVNLKELRLKDLNHTKGKSKGNWEFKKSDLANKNILEKLFSLFVPDYVINLAAQAGVRYSIENPSSYIESNLVGFSNILELARQFKIKHLIYSSSSSVYGGNRKLPFCESHSVDHPISLYAATKKSNELMAHCYSHLYNIPTTGLRYFTVYGPFGRPDMAPMIFAKNILSNKPIKVNNYGNMDRDFTYIDDIVEATIRCAIKPPTEDKNFNKLEPNPSTSFAPYRVLNVGNNRTVNLMDFIKMLEELLGKKAEIKFMPMQQGDVKSTSADINNLKKWIDFSPQTSLEKGLEKFSKWYLDYFEKYEKINN